MRVPTLLPGGRPVTDAAARAEVERAWGLAAGALPATPGRDTDEILAAAAAGELAALVVGGVDPYDLADPAAALAALRDVGFLVSLELHDLGGHRAGRRGAPGRPGRPARPAATSTGRAGAASSARRSTPAACCPDCRVLDTLAVEMDVDLFTQTPAAAAGELARLGTRARRRSGRAAGRAPAEPLRPGVRAGRARHAGAS